MRASASPDRGRDPERAGDRKVFFFVSGGVDSTVAFMLCLDALGSERVRGVYVDTGLMREGETEFVRETFAGLRADSHRRVRRGVPGCAGTCARPGTEAPHHRRAVRKIQERIIEERGIAGRALDSGPGHDLSGHHRIGRHGAGRRDQDAPQPCAGHSEADRRGLIVEPLADFYKDEVRAIGRELGLAPQLLDRHPFPGPGLAIRCLCAETDAAGDARCRMAIWCRCVRWACRAIRAATRRCWRSTLSRRRRRGCRMKRRNW